MLILISKNVLAHNVVGDVYVSGNEIEGEAGFSTGAMANKGVVVNVFDRSGGVLGNTLIGREGTFSFLATKRVNHYFVINMGAGHILKMTLLAEDLPERLGKILDKQTQFEKEKVSSAINITAEQLEKMIARQINPLHREINALKEKSGIRDIIGGIGYIFGLLGLVAFLRERKKKVEK